MRFRFTCVVLALSFFCGPAWSQGVGEAPRQQLPAPALPPVPAAQSHLPTGPPGLGGPQDEGAQGDGQHLLRGPIHEAFAERVERNPQPSPLVTRRPPEPIQEIPPAIKPPGSDVQWIPGYWAWDDEREDFVWVSGVWRKVPPGRRWQPGYWTEVEGGSRWISGTWAPADVDELAQVPPPPQNLDEGPSSPAPSHDSIWIPGCWNYQDGHYLWRPGFWSTGYDDWVWVPERHLWTSGGYVHCGGYWDYPLTYRGYLFAPYAFYRPAYGFGGYWFTPRVLLRISNVFAHLWVRPPYHHYFFGNYYPDRYRKSGYHPWHDYHRRHYSPLLAHYDSYHRRHGIDYRHHRSAWHDKHVRRPDWRPHSVYVDPPGNFPADGQPGPAADARDPGSDRRWSRLDDAPLSHARHRLDQHPHDGRQNMATGVDQLAKPEIRQRDQGVRQAVFLQEPQRRAIGRARQQEVQRLAERRKEQMQARLANGPRTVQQAGTRRTLKPAVRNSGQPDDALQPLGQPATAPGSSRRADLVPPRGRIDNEARQSAHPHRKSSPTTRPGRDDGRPVWSLPRSNGGRLVTPPRDRSADPVTHLRPGRPAPQQLDVSRSRLAPSGDRRVGDRQPPGRSTRSAGPAALPAASGASSSRSGFSPSGSSRRELSRSGFSHPGGARGGSRSNLSHGSERAGFSQGPSKSSVSRGPAGFAPGPSQSGISRKSSGVARKPSGFSRGRSHSNFSRGGGRGGKR
ncbi:MAG: BcpO-related WXXGXW repeat protein [Planctomycetales bacterium]|nr:BcpO-related WXXGXW repeat protein [Planctomycetales bacterium]NIM10031.1 BcpO-related WXXGXW repeat protein [Planctomycetales bacterium]NIN09472.1 BcpO-related WXXGXW repeat protein [Planctomycetales bacterium]NIN78580.1 BcpO-related WXXGXW repeat protein [Planctomycetales bacterium]NIO35774.1 BcpO-related WXXGXW repeat protein [Planctomycetales bacterium]